MKTMSISPKTKCFKKFLAEWNDNWEVVEKLRRDKIRIDKVCTQIQNEHVS